MRGVGGGVEMWVSVLGTAVVGVATLPAGRGLAVACVLCFVFWLAGVLALCCELGCQLLLCTLHTGRLVDRECLSVVLSQKTLWVRFGAKFRPKVSITGIGTSGAS
jgi:hypothetical protein